jgi:ribosomal protein S27AE
MTFFEARPSCPKCGMNMVRNGTRFECLRCGHVEKPSAGKGADECAYTVADGSGAAPSRIAYAAANWPSG